MTEIDPFFSVPILRSFIKQVNESKHVTVNFPRPVARALCYELLRHYESEGLIGQARTAHIQQAAMRYTADHICDLLQSVLDLPQMSEVPSDETISFVMTEIKSFVADAELKVQGNA